VSLLWLLTTPHEFAHAWTAVKLGDDTPQKDGRVTLNPLAHVDWIGTVLLPAATSLLAGGFLGWGRPVQTNPGKLRGGLNGLAAVALAGPASNVVFALLLAAAAVAFAGVWPAFAQFAARGVQLSLYLAIFNMMPVPPLDGSKLLLAARVPPAVYNELARFGFMLLVVAMTASDLGHWMSRWSWVNAERMFALFS
jgi:Zn-dependent protease